MPSGISLQTLAPPTPWLVAVAIALVWLAFRLYGRSGGVGGSRSHALMLGMRLAAIAMLVVFLLEPVLAAIHERSVPARIALLLDGSLSMSIPFPEEGAHVSDVAKAIGKPLGPVTALMKRLLDRGAVVKMDRGKYRIFSRLYARYVKDRS